MRATQTPRNQFFLNQWKTISHKRLIIKFHFLTFIAFRILSERAALLFPGSPCAVVICTDCFGPSGRGGSIVGMGRLCSSSGAGAINTPNGISFNFSSITLASAFMISLCSSSGLRPEAETFTADGTQNTKRKTTKPPALAIKGGVRIRQAGFILLNNFLKTKLIWHKEEDTKKKGESSVLRPEVAGLSSLRETFYFQFVVKSHFVTNRHLQLQNRMSPSHTFHFLHKICTKSIINNESSGSRLTSFPFPFPFFHLQRNHIKNIGGLSCVLTGPVASDHCLRDPNTTLRWRPKPNLAKGALPLGYLKGQLVNPIIINRTSPSPFLLPYPPSLQMQVSELHPNRNFRVIS